jgi:hypothetical protein
MHMMCRRGMTHDVSCQPGTTWSAGGSHSPFPRSFVPRHSRSWRRYQSSTTVRHPTPTWLGADPD